MPQAPLTDNPLAAELATPSRRALIRLAAGAITVAAIGLPAAPVHAATVALADGSLEIVSDGGLTLPLRFVLPDVPIEELNAFLTANGQSTEAFTAACNLPVLRRGETLAVFDAGAGSNFMASTGRLPANLEAAGIDREAVTHVLFTHAHPDHIWGAIDEFDELMFPNAEHLIAAAEIDFWRSDQAMAAVGADREVFVVGARARFEALGDRIRTVQPGEEVLPGIMAIDTSGHTPGHLSYELAGASGGLVIGGDVLTNPFVSFAHPRWRSGTDTDADAGIASRLALLDKLSLEKAALLGFHLPFPGLGRVEKSAGAYRFVVD